MLQGLLRESRLRENQRGTRNVNEKTEREYFIERDGCSASTGFGNRSIASPDAHVRRALTSLKREMWDREGRRVKGWRGGTTELKGEGG